MESTKLPGDDNPRSNNQSATHIDAALQPDMKPTTDAAPGSDTELNPDTAFLHLEELIAKLPEIQEKDRRLFRARNARSLIEVIERTRAFEAEIKHYDETIAQALLDVKQAVDRDDKEEESRNLAIVRMYNELRYTRLAPMQRSENELRELLKVTKMTEADPLAEFSLTDEELAGLEREVESFRDDYQRTFKFCQRLEA